MRNHVKDEIGECPCYITTRCESIDGSCQFIARHFPTIIKFQDEKGAVKQRDEWWLCLFLVARLSEQIRKCFRCMQYATVTMKGQNAAVKDLVRSIQMEYEENLNAETMARDEYDDADRCIVSHEKVGNGLRMAYFYSTSVYDGLCSDARNGIVLGTLEALRHFFKDRYDIQIEVNSEAESEPPVTPFDVVKYRDAEIHVLLEKHSSRLNDHFGPCTSNDVWLQRCKLIEKTKDHSTFKRTVDSTRKLLNVEDWRMSTERQIFHSLALL